MITPDPDPIKNNLKEIRNYLKNEFPGYTFTEDSSHPMLFYKFALTNEELGKCYKLQVSWLRLTDDDNPPANTRAALNYDNVAGQMIQADGHYFCW